MGRPPKDASQKSGAADTVSSKLKDAGNHIKQLIKAKNVLKTLNQSSAIKGAIAEVEKEVQSTKNIAAQLFAKQFDELEGK